MFKCTFTWCQSNRLTSHILGLVTTLAHLACLRWKRRKVFLRSYVSVKNQPKGSYYQVKSGLSFVSCCGHLLFQNNLDNFISVHRNGKLHDCRRSSAIPCTKQKTPFLENTFFFFCDMFSDPLQFLTNKKHNTEDETRTDPIIIGFFVCNLLNCLKSL